MPASIGVNLRVTGHCNQGGRKYMEDTFSVAYQHSSNDREIEYAFFGIFDGHGGGEAATFAKENLMDIIVKQKNFWSDNDEDVLKAIRDGYVNTHYAMWRELDKWPRTASGLPSTAGTTASIAFIRKGKIYIGHVGDSAIILGYQEKGESAWKSKALTKDHKPECVVEMSRIQESGGKVVNKSGVPRVVWNRPRIGHKGPVRRSTLIDEIPFLAVARSLGDLWSYNSELDTFVVSPEPDVKVIEIDVKSHRCLIFGTDGLWNMLSPQAAVEIVQSAEKHNEKHLIASQQTGSGQGEAQMWINPSKSLVDKALFIWSVTRLRADNTSVVTLMLDPAGPTHSETLLSQKREQSNPLQPAVDPTEEIMDSTNLPTECINSPSENASLKPSPPEPTSYPYSTTPIPPPNYETCKQPDSSNQLAEESCDSKYTTSPSKEEKVDESSIQVDEISSSNVTDLEATCSGTSEDANRSIVEEELNVVESSARESGISETETEIESSLPDAEFILDQKSWLQNVPEAEKYSENIENLKTIRHSNSQKYQQQKMSRSRRSMPENSSRSRHVIRTKGSFSSQQQCSVGVKRSANLISNESECEEPRVGVGTRNSLNTGQPSLKRRTRSEDHRKDQDENEPVNQKVELTSRHRWTSVDSSTSKSTGVLNSSNISSNIKERRLSSPNSFKRRSLEKKVTPVKAIRKPTSIARSANGRIQQIRESYFSRDRTSVNLIVNGDSSTPKRWLRSDTIAATPIKNLRSRNVDIAGHTVPAQMVQFQQNINKIPKMLDTPNRCKHHSNQQSLENPTPNNSHMNKPITSHSPPVDSKVRTNTCNETTTASATSNRMKHGCSSTPIMNAPVNAASSNLITKRAKTPYNPSARSLSTRTRIKRLSSSK